jgi:adenylyltransferase/sulfurtransferase
MRVFKANILAGGLRNGPDKVIKITKKKKKSRGITMEEITAIELKRRMDAGEDIQLIDVRQPDEYAFAKIDGAKLIPLGEVINRMGELDEKRETVVHCKMGGRSARAIEALQAAGYKGDLKNMKGGITAWSNEVDPKVPKY